MEIPMDRDRATYWMLCHAINQLHDHKADMTACTVDCVPVPEGDECCPHCCGPCAALDWIMSGDRQWWDDLVRTNTAPDVSALHGWPWYWQNRDGSVNWEALEQCWRRENEACWHYRGDPDEYDELPRMCPKCSEADSMNWHGDGLHCLQGRQAYALIVAEAERGYAPEGLRMVEVPVGSRIIAIEGVPPLAAEDDGLAVHAHDAHCNTAHDGSEPCPPRMQLPLSVTWEAA